jgi:hypothetical protein
MRPKMGPPFDRYWPNPGYESGDLGPKGPKRGPRNGPKMGQKVVKKGSKWLRGTCLHGTMFWAKKGPFWQKLVPFLDPILALNRVESGMYAPKRGPKNGQKTIMAQNPHFWTILGEAWKWALF